MKKRYKALVGMGVALAGTLAVWDSWVTWRYRRDIYDDVEDVPYHRYGLVLGTAPVLANGAVNHYYKYRIEAAALLYQQGKIDVVVVSGTDNGENYSEPEAMRYDLQTMGVPAMSIVMDKGGERTLNSVLYAKSQGLMDDWLIISQAFHNQRSMILAHHLNVRAHAYNARDVQSGLKVQVRERFARMRLGWELLTGRIQAPVNAPPLKTIDDSAVQTDFVEVVDLDAPTKTWFKNDVQTDAVTSGEEKEAKIALS